MRYRRSRRRVRSRGRRRFMKTRRRRSVRPLRVGFRLA